MKALRLLFATLPLFVFSGCFDVETVVRVRPDGSGQVEERMLMGGELIAMAKQMQAMSGDKAQTDFLFKREELEQRAAAMGPGVSLVSVEPLVDEKREGYVAVYAFPDINQVTLNQNPGDKAPSGASMQGDGAGKEKEPITFAFKPGPTPELIIHSPGAGANKGESEDPPKSANKTGSPQDEAAAQMAMAMMKEMFKELRITMAVEVEGEILDTNASFRDGSRVTLMEMDFGKLLANAEKFEEFAKSNPETLADAKAIMQGLDGIKAELNPEIRIRFAGGPRQHLASSPAASQGKPEPELPSVPRKQAPSAKPIAKGPPAPLPTTSGLGDSAPVPPPQVHRATYGWRDINPGAASQHLQKLVRLTDADGVAHKGMLTRLGGGRVTLALAQVDGGGTVQVPLAKVRELKVFDRGR